ncbi:LysR family transcriptional regulator [Pusillimonas sp. DMV24BSW_D]|uniref:LysR substrate-binding domain-containing protein n=1 Tax=Neopusillimonas aestuarii TaxID=2716226 RepID=UPI0014085055|nr:LysR substrate-binding domain-containing protein [Pusillimonas sp. DMV24BSW_D]QIM48240.1 LysR family transcriptional regulator [Pusillimonas sp. DMV24BSW_D]
MEFRQLRYFTALAEELNFTRAAERLHISQPPLSAQIAQLEEELGVKLFYRNSRKVELTDAGAAFLQDVRTVQSRLKDAVQRVQNIHSGLAGRVEIGLSGSHFLGPLPQFISDLAQSHPEIDVVLNEMAPNDQIDALREQRIDISISRQSVDDEFLCSRLLWPDPLLVAMPKKHPLAQHAAIQLPQLTDERFIMLRRETSRFAEKLFNACIADGFTPRVTHTVAEVPAQLSLVSAGLGVAVVPSSTRNYQPNTLHFSPLAHPNLQAHVHAVIRKDHRKAAIDTVLELLQSNVSS